MTAPTQPNTVSSEGSASWGRWQPKGWEVHCWCCEKGWKEGEEKGAGGSKSTVISVMNSFVSDLSACLITEVSHLSWYNWCSTIKPQDRHTALMLPGDSVKHTTSRDTEVLLNIPLDTRSLVKVIVDAQGFETSPRYCPSLQLFSVQAFSATDVVCPFNDLQYILLHIHTHWTEWKLQVFWEWDQGLPYSRHSNVGY